MKAAAGLGAVALGGLWAALAVSVAPAPARAQDLQYYYCFGPNPRTGITYVSDVHPVGDLLERARYPRQFEDFLRVRGKLGVDQKAYCTMRATLREINKGRSELRQGPCRECDGANRMEDILWPRPDGIRVPALRVGGDRVESTARVAPDPADAPDPVPPAPPEQQGAFLKAREDSVDVVAAINVADGAGQVDSKAASRGGKWRSLMSDDRCPGWIGVAFVNKGRENNYFVVRGHGSESAASAAALDLADRFNEVDDANKGVIFTGLNQVEEPGQTFAEHVANFDSGFINGVKAYIRRMVITPCGGEGRKSFSRPGGDGGVRG